MKTLLFDVTLLGHHLEYLHYYYQGAIKRKNEEYIFCVPEEEFLNQKDKYDWQESYNISFEYLSNDELHSLMHKSVILNNIAEARLIAKKIKELGADKVILTNFIHTIPYLLFLLPKKVKVRGIIYRIYLYGKKNIRYKIENFFFWMMGSSSVMEKIFILNDESSAKMLNCIHNCHKFNYLPDPVPVVNIDKLESIRDVYNIPTNNKVFLHFGGLSRRKGTIEILKAINICDEEQLKNKTFIFAGRVYKEISNDFNILLKSSRQKAQVLVFDDFCTYEFLYNLCYSCDVILMPYYQTNLSSGLLGYAAVFGKPVIGPNEGLIGSLIKKYQMGYLLPEISPKSIADSFFADFDANSAEYVKLNSVQEFIDCIFD